MRTKSFKGLQGIVCSVSLLFLSVCFSTNAIAGINDAEQVKIKKGDIVAGNVADKNEKPLANLNVVERNADGRIINATTTDENGDFSFRVNNPKDSVFIKRKGFEPQTLPLDRKYYQIILKDSVEVK